MQIIDYNGEGRWSRAGILARYEELAKEKRRIRRRVFSMLRRGHVPNEFREYAKLVRKIGFDASEIPADVSDDKFVERFRSYFRAVAAGTN